jgi:hypothetical protein
MSKATVRFLLVMIASLAVMTALWTWIAPGYGWATAKISEPVFRAVESPNLTTIEVRGAEIWVLRDVPGSGPTPFTWFDRYVSWSLVPLVALLCATPGLGLRRRFVRLAIGVGALMVAQAIYLVASVELAYAVVIYGRSLGALQIGVRILWEAAPIALWIALTGGTWKRLWNAERSVKKEPNRLSRRESKTAEA